MWLLKSNNNNRKNRMQYKLLPSSLVTNLMLGVSASITAGFLSLWLDNKQRFFLHQLPWIKLYKNALQPNVSVSPPSPSSPFHSVWPQALLPFYLSPPSTHSLLSFLHSLRLLLCLFFFLLISNFRWCSPHLAPLSLFRSLTHLFPCISTSVSFSLLSFHPSHYLLLSFGFLYLSSSSLFICLHTLSAFCFSLFSSFLPLSVVHLQVSGS